MRKTKKNKLWAKELSMKAWKDLAERGCCKCELDYYDDELYFLLGECPLCELNYSEQLGDAGCTPCPIYKKGFGCNESTSIWGDWRETLNSERIRGKTAELKKKRKSLARKIYNIIKAWDIDEK